MNHLLAPVLLVATAAVASRPLPAAASPAAERRITVFYSAEAYGTLEPCGCTSDPLGDFSRMTALVRRAAHKGAVLFVDAGNMSYPRGAISARKQESADLVAAFWAREVSRLPLGGVGLGEADAARGVERIQPKRLAANLADAAFVAPSVVKQVGGISVAVMGLAEPALARKLGIHAEEPVSAAQAEAARLRSKGAEIVIVLAPLDRTVARAVARAANVDFVIVGKEVGGGQARAERVGNAHLLAPTPEMERIGRLDIVLRGPRDSQQVLADAGGVAANRLRLAELERRLGQMETDLVKWEKDGAADQAFVAGKRKEREAMRIERDRLKNASWQSPSQGSYFTNELVPLRRTLPRDPALAASMRRLDKEVGAATLRASPPPPAAEPGRAYYVGQAKCVGCHKASARFCRRTPHAKAWNVLVKAGKSANEDCVSCHVVGFGEVGGSTVGHTKGLEGVQCEACHGPGSLHVEKKGREKPLAIRTKTPESVCTRCHNEKHSDTFEYKAYLRGAIGPGHGEDAFDELGPGPTATELRRAASKRAQAEAQASRAW